MKKRLKCVECHCCCELIADITEQEEKFFKMYCNGNLQYWRDMGEVKEEPTNCSHLPDWCKVGAIGYFSNSYFRIERIDDNNNDVTVVFFGYKGDGQCKTLADYMMTDKEKVTQARQRPFNVEEMQNLVGRIFKTVDGDASIATDFDNIMNSLCIYSEWFKGDELANSVWQLDGKPCYKLEHLNENGEWVE